MKICASHFSDKDQTAFDDLHDSKSIHSSFLKASFLTNKLWVNGQTITISMYDAYTHVPKTEIDELHMSGDLDPIEMEIRDMEPHDAIRHVVMNRIQPIVGLKFEFVDDNQGMVRISFDVKGATYSLVGTDALNVTSLTKETMNFSWIDARTIIHEFGHVLGLIHEHQNPRGNPIEWDTDALYGWAEETYGWDKEKTDDNIVGAYDTSMTNGSNYDRLSIMRYFIPADLTLNEGDNVLQNNTLSCTDIMTISSTYPTKIDGKLDFIQKACEGNFVQPTTTGKKARGRVSTNVAPRRPKTSEKKKLESVKASDNNTGITQYGAVVPPVVQGVDEVEEVEEVEVTLPWVVLGLVLGILIFLVLSFLWRFSS